MCLILGASRRIACQGNGIFYCLVGKYVKKFLLCIPSEAVCENRLIPKYSKSLRSKVHSSTIQTSKILWDGDGWWMLTSIWLRPFYPLGNIHHHPPRFHINSKWNYINLENSIYISQVSIINSCHIFQTSVQCTSRRSQIKEAQRCVDETCPKGVFFASIDFLAAFGGSQIRSLVRCENCW